MKKQSSDTEFETTILNIDPDQIRTKLRKLGAIEQPEILMKRYVYDLLPNEKPEYLRLRSDGNKTTLTYKKRNGIDIGSTEEIEVEVSNFDQAAKMLSKIKSYKIRYQENKRQLFKLGDLEFSIDSWPKIPPYLEIESVSKEKVKQGLKLLGLEGKDSGDIDTQHIYLSYGINLNSFDTFKF